MCQLFIDHLALALSPAVLCSLEHMCILHVFTRTHVCSCGRGCMYARVCVCILYSGSLAYLTGHLHDLDGMLDHIYSQQYSGLLELEMADWKYLRRWVCRNSKVTEASYDILSLCSLQP